MTTLRLPAIEYQQGPDRRLYSFAVDVKRIPEFAAVAHVQRDGLDEEIIDLEDVELTGYQRPEVVRHIQGIRRYLETDASPMIPNALVIAFDDTVVFEPLYGAPSTEYARHGTLVIPVGGDDLPGFVVDGQQRTAAVRDAAVASFPMNVTAFVAASEAEQRTQFILVNNSRPLPAGLIHELLPGTDGTLPRALQRKQFPAAVLERLNHDPSSPFFRRIKTSTTPEGVISDRAVLRLVEDSLAEGVLYRYRDPMTGTGDVEQMCTVLHDFWTAVSDVFPEAWGEDEPTSPRRSRLVHGAGIRAMGFVMDAISDRYGDSPTPTYAQFRQDLTDLAPHCRWTNGTWEFGVEQVRHWNELQNTSKDIQLLTNHLLNIHRDQVWGRDTVRSTA